MLKYVLLVCSALTISQGFNLPAMKSHYKPRAGGANVFVAFSAGLTNSTELHDTHPGNVTYDKVWTNDGNGYDPTTGVFTCPVAGTYVFIYAAMTQGNASLWLDLFHNSNYIATGYAHAVGDYANTGNDAILTLNLNDQVYIKGRGDTYIYGKPDEIYTTFSGFILYPAAADDNSGGIIG